MPPVYDVSRQGPLVNTIDNLSLGTKALYSILFPACEANLNKHVFLKELPLQKKLCFERASAIKRIMLAACHTVV